MIEVGNRGKSKREISIVEIQYIKRLNCWHSDTRIFFPEKCFLFFKKPFDIIRFILNLHPQLVVVKARKSV